MSTTTGPNLAPAKRAVEKLMDDTCTITVDEHGVLDGTVDQDTGRLVKRDPHPGLIYDGPCKVRSEGLVSGTHGAPEGGSTINPRIYTGAIPLDIDGVLTPEIPVGAVLVVTSSRRDPELVGKEFRVGETRYGTMVVSRKFVLEFRE